MCETHFQTANKNNVYVCTFVHVYEEVEGKRSGKQRRKENI